MGKSAQPAKASLASILPVTMTIIAACGINNWALELMVSKKKNPFGDTGAGPLLTLFQFIFIAVIACPNALQLPAPGSWSPFKPTVIPIKMYLLQTVFFFSMSFLNNKAFDYHISQPVHMIFRSSSLVVAFAIGYLGFNRRYNLLQFVSVLIVTGGVLCATTAEAMMGDVAVNPSDCCDPIKAQMGADSVEDGTDLLELSHQTPSELADEKFVTWLIGVGMLIAVMLLGSLLGQIQNYCREQYGAAPFESMFYSHFLSLPLFLAAGSNIAEHTNLWNQSPPARLAWPHLVANSFIASQDSTPDTVFDGAAGNWEWMGAAGEIPIMWHYLIVNLVSQYICVKAVYTLTSRTDSLTVVMSLTVRKVFSLLLSIAFFGNTFTVYHWIGATVVFSGATLYAIAGSPKEKPKLAPAETNQADETKKDR